MLGVRDRSRACRERSKVEWSGAVVVPSAGRAEGDLIAVAEHLLAAYALSVDVRPVQASEITQDELSVPLLEDAVLFRDDLVEKLNGIVRVAPQAIDRAKFDRLLPLGGREDQTCHQFRQRLSDPGVRAQRKSHFVDSAPLHQEKGAKSGKRIGGGSLRRSARWKETEGRPPPRRSRHRRRLIRPA
jgi:hypothetical protein